MSSSLPIYDLTVFQMSKMLRNLDGWLGKAEDYAKEKGFEVDVLLQARLAPDMFPLARQVQAACDNAKFGAARLSGIEAPAHPDEEKTIAELHERIRSTLAFLETVSAGSMAEASAREIQLPFAKGKACTGCDYLVEFATPNFYFHLTTAYALLRHNGVPVGKYDYIGSVKMHDVAAD
ncbi:MAG: DUF1993 domain-containing protein [Myxococcales bacterium]|nr:DUF1993 domain-containing protein [Myxococcales bacterium]